MEITVISPTPFSLPAVVNSHGWVMLAPFQQGDDGSFSYVARLNNGRVLQYSAFPLDGGVCISSPEELNAGEEAELAQQVRWMVGLEQDVSGFYELVRDHPKLGHVVAHARGRLLRSSTLFEDVVKTILTTNTSWAGTIRMNQKLVDQLGDPPLADSTLRAFPTPARLGDSDEETLRKETGLGYRAPYVLQLARAVAEGELDLEALKDPEIPTEELRRRLLAIKGVGNYAAANLLLILGRTDYIPIDSWALRVVSQE